MLRAFFEPGSLSFEPTGFRGRTVWKISGTARLQPFSSTLECDPTGSLRNVDVEIPVALIARAV